MKRREQPAVERVPEPQFDSDPPAEPVQDRLPIRSLRRRCQTEQDLRAEMVEQLLVRRRGGVMELVHDHDIECARLDRLEVDRAERLNRREDMPPLVGTMAVDIQLAERAVAHYRTKGEQRLLQDFFPVGDEQ